MPRNYFINGICLVSVRGSSSSALDIVNNDQNFYELGITSKGGVTITPNYKHRDYKYDDWGGIVPPNVDWMLTDAIITMQLVHFDPDVLSACISESSAGGAEGIMEPAGKIMGSNSAMYGSKNHYITLYLSSPQAEYPWRFIACYLYHRPMVWPLSAQRSLVDLVWRAVPYTAAQRSAGGLIAVNAREPTSSGVKLWDHLAPTAEV